VAYEGGVDDFGRPADHPQVFVRQLHAFKALRHGQAISGLIQREFQTAYPTYPPGITLRIADRLFQSTGGGGAPTMVRSLAVPLRAYQLHGGYTPGPYFLLALLAGLGGIASYRRGRNGPAVLACLLVTGAGVAALLGADVYEFSWRYRLPALVTLPAAGALGVTAIKARVRSSGRMKSAVAGTPPTLGLTTNQRRLTQTRRTIPVTAAGSKSRATPGSRAGH
jgi:hypothetical protein